MASISYDRCILSEHDAPYTDEEGIARWFDCPSCGKYLLFFSAIDDIQNDIGLKEQLAIYVKAHQNVEGVVVIRSETDTHPGKKVVAKVMDRKAIRMGR